MKTGHPTVTMVSYKAVCSARKKPSRSSRRTHGAKTATHLMRLLVKLNSAPAQNSTMNGEWRDSVWWVDRDWVNVWQLNLIADSLI